MGDTDDVHEGLRHHVVFFIALDIRVVVVDRNADKLREAARLRMQRRVPQILVLYSLILVDPGIAAVASSDIFTQCKYARKVALASERYRDRKRDEEHAERRAADAVTRQARGIEKDVLHRKHTKLKKVLPLPLIAIPPPHTAKPPHTISKPCAASPSSPTPALVGFTTD
ncbi:hypothetical protein DFH08DRAFT_1023483 [Mycena albidolilacea]|uniref:Uncharacterized protein n=1 Tax=Mycena albidolilacea TaxID=1033008 RepID=A0AAD6ZM34_9AGAR|nr:hypothetical protein DFH08DRAFT_1023483 [Mycena albidolilacea]